MKRRVTSLVGIKANDPLKEIKFKLIEGANRIADLTNSLNRDMENRFLMVLSIVLTGVMGFLVAKEKITIALILGLCLVVVLLLTLTKEEKEKNQL